MMINTGNHKRCRAQLKSVDTRESWSAHFIVVIKRIDCHENVHVYNILRAG